MMANVELTCSVCSQSNLVQRVHTNMLVKDEMRTFCSTCGIVTLQRISGGAAPPVAQQTPIRSNSPTRSMNSVQPMNDNELWNLMENQLRSNGLLLDDVSRRDDETRARLFGSLGFGLPEEQRLVEMAKRKFGNSSNNNNNSTSRNSNPYRNTPSTPPAAPTEPRSSATHRSGINPAPAPQPYQPTNLPSNMAGGGGNRGSNNNTPRGNANGTPPLANNNTNNASSNHRTSGVPGSNSQAAARLQSNSESAVKGLSMNQDGSLIARCSVYPHLPAEFWCCACSVLVSSRCHVQGIHKDHPFVPLRLAAESHVRDLCAWNDRCRAQLNVIDTISNNLRHCEEEMTHNLQRELQNVDEAAAEVQRELERWKEQLKSDVQIQVNAQMGGLQFARDRTHELREHYGTYLAISEPLMNSIPPVNAEDREAEHWALRVLDAVTKLKHVTAEAIPIPKLTIPQVQCNAAPSMFQELLKCASVPLQMKLPDLIDPGYFNYPHPSSSARQAFTLVAQGDPQSKGLVITNGRTLTRTQDVLPSHCLVMGSQVMYSGNHGWEVHVDRIGNGGGRILAGVVVNGSDGEGVVWDGNRIVGPNEGEVRNLDDKIVWQTGSILRFYLELEGPTGYLNCFFNNEGVARIPLPASGSGWTPAFSVFGPQDQVTVAPSTTSAGGPGVAIAGNPRSERRSAAATSGDTISVLEEQGSMLNALHQQISHINFKLEQQQLKAVNPYGTESVQRDHQSQQPQPQHQSQLEALNPQQGSYYSNNNNPNNNSNQPWGNNSNNNNNMMMNGQPNNNSNNTISGWSPNPARPGQMQPNSPQGAGGAWDPNNTVYNPQNQNPNQNQSYNNNQNQNPNQNQNQQYNNNNNNQQNMQQQHHQQQQHQAAPNNNTANANNNNNNNQSAAAMFSGTDTYSPELRQIMKYVESVNH